MTGSAAERFSVLPPARLLVVGASGYLAGFVVAALQGAGYRLRGFDRMPLPADRVLDEFVVGDMTCQEDVRQAVVGQDGVILLAGLVRGRRDEPLERFADVMVKGTWLVLDAAAEAGVRRVVSISSIVAIGAPPTGEDALLTEARAPRMGGVDLYYQLSKWLGEELGRAYASARGVSVVSLRPGVIAGDGANAGPVVPAHPTPRWFIYVDPRDVAQAIDGALCAPDPQQSSYFVVAGHPEAAYDISAARRDLGYAPQHNWLELRSR